MSVKTCFRQLPILLFLCLSLVGFSENTVKLTIFHTNDLHQELKPLPRIAYIVKEHKKTHPNTLFFDAGDFFERGEAVADITRGEAIYGAMALMDYDVVTLGNHEWAYGVGYFKDLIERYPLQVMLANVKAGRTPLPVRNFQKTMIYDCKGLKVGIFATTLNYFPRQKDWSTTEVKEAARRAIESLKKKGAKFIIALTHAGMKNLPESQGPYDPEMAKLFPDIKVIVGGHCHTLIKKDEVDRLYKETGAIIHQSGGSGNQLGRIDLTINRRSGDLVDYQVSQLVIDHEAKGEPAVKKFIDKMYKRHFPDHKTLATTIPPELKDHDIGAWVTDFIRDKTNSDIAISGTMRGYGFHKPFYGSGEYSLKKLLKIIYDRVIVKGTVKGKDLIAFIEKKKWNRNIDHFNILHPEPHNRIHHSGIKFKFDQSSKKVTTDIDPDRYYRVAFSWKFFIPASYPKDPMLKFNPNALNDNQLPEDIRPLFYKIPVKNPSLVKKSLWTLIREHVAAEGPFSLKALQEPADYTAWLKDIEERRQTAK